MVPTHAIVSNKPSEAAVPVAETDKRTVVAGFSAGLLFAAAFAAAGTWLHRQLSLSPGSTATMVMVSLVYQPPVCLVWEAHERG